MAGTMINLRIAPRRMISQRDAAAYCGLPLKSFPGYCNVAPVQMPNQKLLYDMKELDKYLDDLSESDVSSEDEMIAGLPD